MLRLEYRYTDPGDNKFNFPGDINTKVKYKTNDIRLNPAKAGFLLLEILTVIQFTTVSAGFPSRTAAILSITHCPMAWRVSIVALP